MPYRRPPSLLLEDPVPMPSGTTPSTIGPYDFSDLPRSYQHNEDYLGTIRQAVDRETRKTYIAQVFDTSASPDCEARVIANVERAKSVRHPAVLHCYRLVQRANFCAVLWEPIAKLNARDQFTSSDFRTRHLLVLQLLTATAVLQSHGGFPRLQLLDIHVSLSKKQLKVMPNDRVLDPLSIVRNCNLADRIECSPDVLRTGVLGELSIWDVGVIAFRMMTFAPAFPTASLIQQRCILDGEYGGDKLSIFSPLAEDFFSSIFKPHEKDRASADVLMLHPWFDETIEGEEKRRILSTDCLVPVVSERLLPADIVDRLATYLPYLHRWTIGGTNGSNEQPRSDSLTVDPRGEV